MAPAASSDIGTIRLHPPNQGGVRVWLARSDAARADLLRHVLDADERADTERLAVNEDRVDAVCCRGLWRLLAAEMMGVTPDAVVVERTAFGRAVPSELPRTEGDLAAASTRGLVLMAGARGGVRVGVGLAHRLKAALDDRIGEVGEGIIGPALDLIPDRTERLVCCQGLHQALMMADGRGVHLGSGAVTAEVRSLWGWNQAKVGGTAWWVRRLRMPEGYEGSVACSSPCESFEIVDLDGAEGCAHG